MMQVRKSEERGHANHGWLDTYHSFSFANYYDPNRMGFSALRVINEDIIAPGQGFGTHSHRDMEIITYLLSGELAHKDSMGNVETIRAGEVQRMTAGSGVTHSEFNASKSVPVHLLQIWIEPNQLNLAPSYEDKLFADADKLNRWGVLASQDAREGSLLVHQDVLVLASRLDAGKRLDYAIKQARCSYLHIAKGSVEVNGQALRAGDAAIFSEGEVVEIVAQVASELLLFDLPPDA